MNTAWLSHRMSRVTPPPPPSCTKVVPKIPPHPTHLYSCHFLARGIFFKQNHLDGGKMESSFQIHYIGTPDVVYVLSYKPGFLNVQFFFDSLEMRRMLNKVQPALLKDIDTPLVDYATCRGI